MERTRKAVLLTALLMLVLTAGVASGQEKIKGVTGTNENPLTPVEGPFKFKSMEGDFRVIWPSGCHQVLTRTPMDEGDSDDWEKEQPVMVYCDRNGEKGEGCSVTAIFNVRGTNGSEASPDQVVARMQKLLASFGADITNQKPLKKDFGNGVLAEGLDVLAAQKGGSGQVWLRGMLIRGDIYIMSAWDLKGAIAQDPEYITFFNSFQPGTE